MMAATLYDGKWRWFDWEQIKKEYDINNNDPDIICELLKSYEEKEIKWSLSNIYYIIFIYRILFLYNNIYLNNN